MSFADRIIQFNHRLKWEAESLPPGIQIMNPFQESPEVLKISDAFYRKYYDDDRPRYLILGINPGRFGAGLTGIPFTDPKRLMAVCQIPYDGRITHEPSSAYIYEMIHTYGGPEAFYGKFHINSMCPLGFTKTDEKGGVKNYNYYDSPELINASRPFIVANIRKQIALGTRREVCICLGTGKNEQFLRKLNKEHGFFKEILALEHPRFIMQYRSTKKSGYIDKYISVLKSLVLSSLGH